MLGFNKKVVDTTDKDTPKDDAIIKEALSRYTLMMGFEKENRKEAAEDLRMLAGRDHWPKNIVKKRTEEDRPVLTINKLPSFTDQVKNNSRMNKMSIKVHPYGGGSTPELADTFAGLIRNIEEVSDADIAYQTALDGAVDNGFGYFRIVTTFVDNSFFQEIEIRPIRDCMSVHLDPYCSKPDGSDAKYGIIEESISREEYKARYPGKEPPVPFPSTHELYSWSDSDNVIIAEYWKKVPTTKRLYLLSDGRTVDGDEWDAVVEEIRANEKVMHLEPNPQNPQGPPIPVEGPAPEGSGYSQEIINPTPEILRERKVDTSKVVHYLIDGEKIIEGPEDWAGSYIPIIPVWGKEIVINNEVVRRGVIRFAKDPQRMYNYFRTAAVETTALAPKAPYIGEEGQFEGHEDEWDAVGTENQSRLTYKNVPGVPPPTRQVVTQTAIGEITESNLSNDEMKAATSIYDASLGAQGNEISGIAIQSRRYGGDVANYTYHDNLVRAIKLCGKILVDLIPKIYDTERQVIILRPDEIQETVLVNQVVNGVKINDLSQGRYKVTVSSGPSFSTQRIEASQSMLDFLRVAPEQGGLIIDLVAENMDWPGAAKIAKRFRKMLPPGIDDDAPMPPAQPTMDDILKELKAQGITLGNEIKKLNIVSTRRELEGHDRQVAEAGAEGAMAQLGLFGDNR